MRELKLALKDLWNHRFLVLVFLLFNLTVSLMVFQMYNSYTILSQKNVTYHIDFYNSENKILLEDKKTIIKFVEDHKLNFHFRFPMQINDTLTEALVLVGYYNDDSIVEIDFENKKYWSENLKKYNIEDDLDGIRKIVFINQNYPENIIDGVTYTVFSGLESMRDIQLINKYNSLIFKSIYTKMNVEVRSIAIDTLVFYFGIIMFVIVILLVLYKIIGYIAYKMLKEYEIHIFYGSNLKSIIFRSTLFYSMIWIIVWVLMNMLYKKNSNVALLQCFSLIQVLMLYIFYLVMLHRLNILRREKS